jgi:DNA mismatch repair protein MutS2
MLADSSELLDLIRYGDPLPLRHVEVIESLLDEAGVLGAHLDGQQLLLIADFCALVGDLSRYAKRCEGRYPRLKNRLDALQPADEFRHTVEASFEPDGTLKESASPRLKELRRAIQKLQSSILEKLQKEAARLGGDSVVTQREGRYVVSVGEHDRGKVRGIVHDRSQAGTTYFIEPLGTLDAGNDLRSAIMDERNEVLRILTAITAQLREVIPDARRDISLIAEIDSAWGKARWAARHGANPPQLSDGPDLKLASARHPLLLAQELDAQKSLQAAHATVVPFNLELNDTLRAIVISGPNTGGKTVGLKTAGLAVLMVQAGVPPTLEPSSVIGSFDGVFADIGDEQSLALSLSTFSAHLKQVGFACASATARSLLLFDELGVGTDPEEGSALARAVITTLVERGARVLVTTHYSSLKILTEQDSRIVNAAFLFDEENLSPTYQLVVGRPGASYALEIARRLGFPGDIVGRAEQGVGRQAKDLANLLARLAEQELQLRAREQEVGQQQARLSALVEFNQAEQEKWKRLGKTAERDAHRQAKLIVDEARRETERLVSHIRQTNAGAEAVKDAHRTFDRLAHKSEPRPEQPAVTEPFELTRGKRVHVRDINADGEITNVMPDGERVQVLIGSMHYTVHRSELAPAASSGAHELRPASRVKAPPLELKSFEIDLRGRTAEEAQIELDEAFEAALQQGMKELRIIHGRGTGALRQKLTQWFRQHPRIQSFRLGGIGEGGDGVSIVALKKS